MSDSEGKNSAEESESASSSGEESKEEEEEEEDSPLANESDTEEEEEDKEENQLNDVRISLLKDDIANNDKEPLLKKNDSSSDELDISDEEDVFNVAAEDDSEVIVIEENKLENLVKDNEDEDEGEQQEPYVPEQESESSDEEEGEDDVVDDDVFEDQYNDEKVMQSFLGDEGWKVNIHPDGRGDLYYQDRSSFPTMFCFCFFLCICLCISMIVVSCIPFVPKEFDWWWPVIGIVVSPICGCTALFSLLIVSLRVKSVRTTFSNQTQLISVTRRFDLIPFLAKTTVVRYTDISEFIVYQVGQKTCTRMLNRFLVVLQKKDGKRINISGKMPFSKDGKEICKTLNQCLVSSIPV